MREFIFLDEGKEINHKDFGEAFVFKVLKDNIKHNFYIKPTNFKLLNQIRNLGILTGKRIILK